MVHSSRHNFGWLVLSFFEAIIALYLVWTLYTLPYPPSTRLVNAAQLIAVVFFYMCLAISFGFQHLSKRRMISKLITLGIFTLAMLLGFFAAQPGTQPRSDNERTTSEQKAAVVKGIDLGQQVKQNKISQVEADAQIQKEFGNDQQALDFAKQAQQSAAQTSKTEAQILSDALPTIPVRLDAWTCNDVGCSYADNNNVWTISTYNHLGSTLILAVSVIGILWLMNFPIWHKLFLKLR